MATYSIDRAEDPSWYGEEVVAVIVGVVVGVVDPAHTILLCRPASFWDSCRSGILSLLLLRHNIMYYGR